jgi:hypothetical protein
LGKEGENMRVWITKYALTQGILEKEADICKTVSGDMIEIQGTRFAEYYHGKGRDWHLTKEDAIKKAEKMKQNKIKNIEKQLDNLRNLKFE